jgi:hypothetical protein
MPPPVPDEVPELNPVGGAVLMPIISAPFFTKSRVVPTTALAPPTIFAPRPLVERLVDFFVVFFVVFFADFFADFDDFFADFIDRPAMREAPLRPPPRPFAPPRDADDFFEDLLFLAAFFRVAIFGSFPCEDQSYPKLR